MLKKTVSYEDFNGNKQTEDFYFNLTRTELLELEYSLGPGSTLSDMMQTLIDSQDYGAIVNAVKKIVLTSYGQKSSDGKRFVKNDELRTEFEQSAAYDELYMELSTDAEAAAEFLNGIMPAAITRTLGDNPKQVLLDKMKELGEGSEE